MNKTKKKYKNIKRKNTFVLLLYFLLSFSFLCAIILMLGIFYASKDLPVASSIKDYKSSLATKIYSADGILLNSYALENRIFVPINEIPDVVKNAFLAAEDANFYHHGGIDFIGILKAAYKNILFFAFKEGQLVGASTITQQVVKNILLTNERTVTRKIKEIILSIELSKVLSKDEVFEIYLNHIYLGSGAYGVMAASIEYFGKNLKDLTPQEAAVLAALPKAPSDINPRRRKDRALERRNWVLARMLENKFLSKNEYMEAVEAPLEVVPQSHVKPITNGVNTFSDYIKSSLSAVYGSDAFFSGGYFVKTTLDYTLQESLYKSFRENILDYDKKMGYRGIAGVIGAEQDFCSGLVRFIEEAEIKDILLEYAVVLKSAPEGLAVMDSSCAEKFIPAKNLSWAGRKPSDFARRNIIVTESVNGETILSQMPEANGAAIVINPKNGDVLAMMGDFFDRPNGFNRAVSAKRQLGSAVKPFVYITALENGFTPSSILVDEDLKLSDEWQPRNASRDFLGGVTLRVALERSRNVPTVRVSEIVGISKTIKRFSDFGLNTEPLDYDLSTTLGSFNTTPERVAKAYSVFVNGGKKVETNYITKIQTAEGKKIFSKDGTCGAECFDKDIAPDIRKQTYGERVATPERAYQILSILEGAVQRGTANRMRTVSPFGIAGKTGSTSDHKDAWFVGLTNDLLIVIYIGHDKPKSLGDNQYGSVLALPVAKSFFESVKAKNPNAFTPFAVPEGIVQVEVDYTTGSLANKKTQRKITENFTIEDTIPKPSLNFEDMGNEDLNSVNINELEKKITDGIY